MDMGFIFLYFVSIHFFHDLRVFRCKKNYTLNQMGFMDMNLERLKTLSVRVKTCSCDYLEQWL